jgi:hypothetical protein
MPTEHEILAAGPLSPDDPRVQAALKRLSRGMNHVVMRLEQRARRTAAEPAREDPPPKDKKGAERPTSSAPPSNLTSTNTPAGDQTVTRRLCLPPV